VFRYVMLMCYSVVYIITCAKFCTLFRALLNLSVTVRYYVYYLFIYLLGSFVVFIVVSIIDRNPHVLAKCGVCEYYYSQMKRKKRICPELKKSRQKLVDFTTRQSTSSNCLRDVNDHPSF
jgi:dolichyl-phosphate-mannose--protein O-mannosyl transferase